MANKRVREIMAMLEAETDPDQIQILEFDLDEAMGRKDAGMKKGVKKRAYGGSEMTDSHNKKVRKARHGGQSGGNYDGDEVMAAGSCRGGGAAIKGTDFKGLF